MLQYLTARTLVVVWCLVVPSIAVLASALGAGIGPTGVVLLFAAAIVPPTIVLFVWRDSAPSTVAELIHDVENS